MLGSTVSTRGVGRSGLSSLRVTDMVPAHERTAVVSVTSGAPKCALDGSPVAPQERALKRL